MDGSEAKLAALRQLMMEAKKKRIPGAMRPDMQAPPAVEEQMQRPLEGAMEGDAAMASGEDEDLQRIGSLGRRRLGSTRGY